MFNKYKVFGLFLAVVIFLSNSLLIYSITAEVPKLQVNESGAWFEAAYAQWEDYPQASSYNVYYKISSQLTYSKVDSELIRNNRVDIPGLRGNTAYDIKIVPVVLGIENEFAASNITVIPEAYDRSGFAFSEQSPNKVTTGGYNLDGTVPDNADIVYVTDATKDTVVYTMSNPVKGKSDTYVGIVNIMASRESTKDKTPLIIRIIGTVNQPRGVDKLELATIKRTANITIEGIGPNSGIYGWGINVRENTNIEIRNLSFGGQSDDCISVQSGNRNIWIHNNDFFWGKDMGGDKSKGDGSADVKQDSSFVTLSYNHYHDTGKGALVGQGDSKEFFVTIHHNYFDASDSRHPRVRYGSVHVYNNYFKDIDVYGVAAGEKSSVFVENNYFENTNRPMIISRQGHALAQYTGIGDLGGTGNNTLSGDTGGALKQTGNYLDETSKFKFSEQYDTGNSKYDGWSYNNFDLQDTMYDYVAHTPEDAKARVIAYAGRMKGGTVQPEVYEPLDAPKNLTLTLGEPKYNVVQVSWNSVEGATGYKVKYGTDQNDLVFTANVDASNLSVLINNLNPDTTYYFGVMAMNRNTEGQMSDIVYTTTSVSNTPYIIISQQPYKTTYTVADTEFDTDGMVVKLVIGAQTTQIALDDVNFSLSGFNTAEVGSQIITVVYNYADQILTDTFNIKIIPVIETPSLDDFVAMGTYILNSNYVTKKVMNVDNINYNLEATEAARIKLKGGDVNYVMFKVDETCTLQTDPSNRGMIISTLDGNIFYNNSVSQSVTTPTGDVMIILQPGTYKIEAAQSGQNTYLTKFVFTPAVWEPIN